MSYIDRIRTIETIRGQQCTACKVYDNGNGCKDCIVHNIANVLWDMPEANAESVTEGRWEPNPSGVMLWCSNCHGWYEVEITVKKFKYCPNCGARMGT